MAKTELKTYEVISQVDFSTGPMKRTEFEGCEFISCHFSDLSKLSFIDCVFKTCNLSNAKAIDSHLRNCSFKDCKLLGTNFSRAKELTFEVHFENCLMDYASFDKKKMHQSSFKHCKLHGANFTQADASKCTFAQCDFYEALFSGTNLGGVDLSSCVNFIIDPELNNIKKARFALNALPGLLQRYDIRVE